MFCCRPVKVCETAAGRVQSNTRLALEYPRIAKLQHKIPYASIRRDGVNQALKIEGVGKSYDGRKVVDDVSLDVMRGETFGLVGPNGSGKTTTIRMALDIIRPDAGRIELFGNPLSRNVLSRVGYLPEERGMYQRSKVSDVLTYLGRLKRMESGKARARMEELLKRVGLHEHRDKKVSALSRGMTQLVQFCGALIHDPDLIVLDEPFSGLDPLNVQLMKEIIREQRERGAAVIFSTHQMTDVEELCERVLLISESRVLLYGNLAEIKRARGTQTVRIVAGGPTPAIKNAGQIARVERDGVTEYTIGGVTEPEKVLRSFLDLGAHVERYEVVLPTLNEIFIDEVSRARRKQ